MALLWRGAQAAGLPISNLIVPPYRAVSPTGTQFPVNRSTRGEGAYLKRPDGTRFMPDFVSAANWPRAILSPAPLTMK